MDSSNNDVVHAGRLLDILSEMYTKRDAMQVRKQELIDEIITNEIKEKLAKVEKQFESSYSKISTKISALETEIRGKVKTIGSTVRGFKLMAVWSKAPTKWDTASLEGYAAGGHPEILQFKKVGEPSVSIREIK